MKTKSLSPYIGELVEDTNIVDLTTENIQELKMLLHKRKAVFFKNQFLSDIQLKQFGVKLQSLNGRIEYDEIDNTENYEYGSGWHTDKSYNNPSPPYTIFQIDKLPKRHMAGDTEFVNTESLYTFTVSPRVKELLKTLTATHTHLFLENIKEQQVKNATKKFLERTYLTGIHPVIRKEEFNGIISESIFVNECHTEKINELNMHESETILNLIYKKILNHSEFRYRHRWEEGSVVIWNNNSSQHKGLKDFMKTDTRKFKRCVVY